MRKLVGTKTLLSGIRITRIATVPVAVVTQLRHQIAMLVELGADLTVVCSDGKDIKLLRGMRGLRCEVIDIQRAISPGRDLLALIRLFFFFRRNRIQIAHSTTPKAGLVNALAAFLAGVPVRLHTFTGQPWVNMRGLKGWLSRSSDVLIGRLNTRCYADSKTQRQFLIDHQIMNDECLHVIGSGSLAGVDIQRFDNNRFSLADCVSMKGSLEIPEGAPVLLFVGRITEDKGVKELLQAFGVLKAASNKAHLVLVGSLELESESGVGGAILQGDIEQLPDVHIVGFSECPEAFMAIADVLCLPSYREGFGTVVIEAAAMSVPTVGTDIYGLIDSIMHEETGLLVPPKNVEALVSAISRMLDDSALRLRMGEAAKRRAHALYDAEKFNQQVADEYCALLLKKGIIG
jgi:glycosyltransferase involved in cell wall biosynthesis|tara:strand:- start:2207 stop:3418 length:1212 start_codon:yes stop_codon:yes gene_type:complete